MNRRGIPRKSVQCQRPCPSSCPPWAPRTGSALQEIGGSRFRGSTIASFAPQDRTGWFKNCEGFSCFCSQPPSTPSALAAVTKPAQPEVRAGEDAPLRRLGGGGAVPNAWPSRGPGWGSPGLTLGRGRGKFPTALLSNVTFPQPTPASNPVRLPEQASAVIFGATIVNPRVSNDRGRTKAFADGF
jgi:hypothetical protein